jgi:hypothetical protein
MSVQAQAKEIADQAKRLLEAADKMRQELAGMQGPTVATSPLFSDTRNQLEQMVPQLQRRLTVAERLADPKPLPQTVTNANTALRPPPGVVKNEGEFARWERSVSEEYMRAAQKVAEAWSAALTSKQPDIAQSALSVFSGEPERPHSFDSPFDALERNLQSLFQSTRTGSNDAIKQLMAAALFESKGGTEIVKSTDFLLRCAVSFGSTPAEYDRALKHAGATVLKPKNSRVNYIIPPALAEASTADGASNAEFAARYPAITSILKLVKRVDQRSIHDITHSPLPRTVELVKSCIARLITENRDDKLALMLGVVEKRLKDGKQKADITVLNSDFTNELGMKPLDLARSKRDLTICGILRHQGPGGNRAPLELTPLGLAVFTELFGLSDPKPGKTLIKPQHAAGDTGRPTKESVDLAPAVNGGQSKAPSSEECLVQLSSIVGCSVKCLQIALELRAKEEPEVITDPQELLIRATHLSNWMTSNGIQTHQIMANQFITFILHPKFFQAFESFTEQIEKQVNRDYTGATAGSAPRERVKADLTQMLRKANETESDASLMAEVLVNACVVRGNLLTGNYGRNWGEITRRSRKDSTLSPEARQAYEAAADRLARIGVIAPIKNHGKGEKQWALGTNELAHAARRLLAPLSARLASH